MNISNINEKFGCLVTPSNKRSDIDSLNIEDVVSLYKKYGAVQFRGFCASECEFIEFAKMFTKNTTRNGNPARESIQGNSQLQVINTDSVNIPFHSENAFIPFRPESIWFYCQIPAERGGETTLCDGIDVTKRLNYKIRSYLESVQAKYISKNVHQSAAATFFDKNMSISEITNQLSLIPNLEISNVGEFFDISYTTSPFVTLKEENAQSFSNALLTEYDIAEFTDGKKLEDRDRFNIFTTCAQGCIQIKWQPNDFVFVDNIRVMHGRLTFDDQRRRIYTVMGDNIY